jgi:predicted nuclease of restriction endonuclease-like RecB superfamily
VLRSTRRYGAAMARFVPALLACRGWRMRAEIVPGHARRPLHLDLTAEDGLTSHLPSPGEFDSQVEESFANRWGPEKREGWTLIREGEILVRGQKAFCPDFTFRHDDGRVVLLEIVGFWTPQYLQAKRATLAAFADDRLLLALAEPMVAQWGEAAGDAILFKSSLSVQDVLERVKASDSWVARP